MMMITEKGQMVRIGIKDTRPMGRATQGVRLLKIREGDRLIASARIAEEEAEIAAAKVEGEAAIAATSDQPNDAPPTNDATTGGDEEE